LIGHHGVFSLTPIWLLSMAGLAIWGFGRSDRPSGCGQEVASDASATPPGETDSVEGEVRASAEVTRTGPSCRRSLAILVAAVTLACFAFYLSRPLAHRNYGGMTSGFRWMFWLAPLWIVVMIPAADRMASRRVARGVALVLLALSVLSASYPTWNPWTLPWLTNWWIYLGWESF
jgi:hypothetical protein